MSVPIQNTVFTYTANGATTSFPYECYVIAAGDISVYLNDVLQTSGYVVNGVGNVSGGDVVFSAPPAAGTKVRIERDVDIKRDTQYQVLGDFRSPTVNADFDRLWMVLQRIGYFLGIGGPLSRVLRLGDGDVNGQGAYRANQNRIQDLGDPQNGQDAVNQRSMYAYVEKAIAGVVGGFGWFIQTGTGAIFRTFQDKMRDFFSSRDYDVSADGTNQAAKLQNAVNAATALYVPSATLRVDQTVRANGKPITFLGSVRAYNNLIPEQLAHEQIIPSMIIADTYTPYDYARFGKMDPVIMAYGDSNTAWVDENSQRIGVGQGSWPAYLEAYLAQYVYFANGRVRGDGSPGQTSQFALDNFDLFMSTYNPQIAVLGWGTNDIAKGVPRDQYIANMALLLERFQQAGVLPIVLGIPWHVSFQNEVKAWNSSLAKLCANYGVDFVPVFTAFGNAPSTYFATDGIHYTVVANQVLASVIGEMIVRRYGIPKNSMRMFTPRPGSSVDTGSWICEGIRHTNGRRLHIVQTPDVYLRRLFPYAIRIEAGQEVSIASAGPFAALFDWPDSSGSSWTVNGGAFSPITRGAVVKLTSTSPRLDGSSGTFRVGCTAGAIYLVATLAEFGFPPQIHSTSEIRNGLYIPGRRITVSDGTRYIDTVMREVSGATDIGYAPDIEIPNVGPSSTRTSITNAPVGFKFLQSDNETWYYWDGSAWVSL